MTSQASNGPASKWRTFIEVTMLVVGVVQLVNGIFALLRPDVMNLPGGMSVHVDYKAVGWILVILGLLVLAAAVTVMISERWARPIGIGTVVVSLLFTVILFWADPIWIGLVIVLDIAVIYALVAHGKTAGLGR